MRIKKGRCIVAIFFSGEKPEKRQHSGLLRHSVHRNSFACRLQFCNMLNIYMVSPQYLACKLKDRLLPMNRKLRSDGNIYIVLASLWPLGLGPVLHLMALQLYIVCMNVVHLCVSSVSQHLPILLLRKYCVLTTRCAST